MLSVSSVVNTPMTDNYLTHEIIGAAIEVHKNLTPAYSNQPTRNASATSLVNAEFHSRDKSLSLLYTKV